MADRSTLRRMPGPICAVMLPPMANLNTPYAALPQLAAWVHQLGAEVVPVDASLAVALKLYSAEGLTRLFAAVAAAGVPDDYHEVVANRDRYVRIIEPLVHFLQGRDPSLAGRLVRQAALPQGPRFAAIDPEDEAAAFGLLGQTDQARWLGTLVLQDLADLVRATICPSFGLTSYGTALAESASSFDDLHAWLQEPADLITTLLAEVLAEQLPETVDLVVITCPFPGNLPGALRAGQWLREWRPDARVLLGGGYPSTELRELSDVRPFACFDAIVIDDGMRALERWLAIVAGAQTEPVACFIAGDEAAQWCDGAAPPPAHDALPAPRYQGLPMGQYLDLLDSWNPMHRLWNEGRWLKLTAAHGCYWKRCTFCDTSLPYIGRFQPARARHLADRMDAMAAETGCSGFHFTDEAAPPSLLVQLALELLRRGRSYHWWGNIRFDDYFTADRCRLLAAAGMVAVSGGIEVAEATVLERVGKGVDLPQLVRVCHGFASAGILVHGYLMYGFPGQTLQQTIDSAEMVRQLFAAGILHSGFWHRFTVTAHAPIGADPDAYGIAITGPVFAGFARNNLRHEDPHGADADALGPGLAAALDWWMQSGDTDTGVASFLEVEPQVPTSFVDDLIAAIEPVTTGRPCWLGAAPSLTADGLCLIDETGALQRWPVPAAVAAVVVDMVQAAMPAAWGDRNGPELKLPEDWAEELRPHGLVLV